MRNVLKDFVHRYDRIMDEKFKSTAPAPDLTEAVRRELTGATHAFLELVQELSDRVEMLECPTSLSDTQKKLETLREKSQAVVVAFNGSALDLWDAITELKKYLEISE